METVMTRILIVAGWLLLCGASVSAQQRGSMLERADANGDGSITRAEMLDARAKLFSPRDRNGDGHIDAGDVPSRAAARPRVASGMTKLRQLLDSNGDGKVSKQEFIDGGLAIFTRADTDHNDTLDAKELAAAREAVKQRAAGGDDAEE